MAEPMPLIAVVPSGLEQLAAREIRALGGGIGHTRVESGRVLFEGPPDAMMRANLGLSVAERVLIPLAQEPVHDFRRMRELVAGIPLEDLMPAGLELRFQVSARGCRLFHSGAVADAIREGILARRLGLPRGDGQNWLTLDARGSDDLWTLTMDSTGPGLWRRGYRLQTAKAPLRENLTAALLLLAGWKGDRPLLDPTCGSGTIAIEAARMAQRRAAGLDRTFAFERFPVHDAARWAEIKDRAEGRVDPEAGGVAIEGADAKAGAIRAALGNSRRAGTASVVRFLRRPIDRTPAAEPPGLVVMNPPYGRRTEGEDLAETWRTFRSALAASRPGWDVVFLAADRAAASEMGATGRPLARFRNGGIPVAAWRTTA